jgi:hypothetical protein
MENATGIASGVSSPLRNHNHHHLHQALHNHYGDADDEGEAVECDFGSGPPSSSPPAVACVGLQSLDVCIASLYSYRVTKYYSRGYKYMILGPNQVSGMKKRQARRV